MANVIEQAAKALRARLAELVGEQQQLQKALGALEGLLGSERGSGAATHTSKTARRPPARRAAASARGRATTQRRRSTASRAEQFVALVSEQPGITVAEAAERLGTSRNTLYNLTGRLQRDGRLRKDGRGYYPIEQPPAPATEEPSADSPPSAS